MNVRLVIQQAIDGQGGQIYETYYLRTIYSYGNLIVGNQILPSWMIGLFLGGR